MKKTTSVFVFVLLCSSCGAFSQDECNTSGILDIPSSVHKNARELSNGTQSFTLDDHLAEITNDVPGFGGFYFDEPNLSGTLNIYLLEPSQEAAEKASGKLANIFQQGHFLSAPVRAVQGQYDYADLLSWYRETQGIALTDPDGSFTDINETKNRIVYGAVNEEAIERIKSALLEYSHIPGFLAQRPEKVYSRE